MKRGGPLRRRTPLVARKPLQAKQPLQPGKALAAGKALARSAWGSSSPQPQGKAAEAARLASGAWHAQVTALGCQVCKYEAGQPLAVTYCTTPVQGHHVLPQEYIKRVVRTVAHNRGMDDAAAAANLIELLWDPRNGLGVCTDRHAQHTNGSKRIPRALVPKAAWAFAIELGELHVLEQQYPAVPVPGVG